MVAMTTAISRLNICFIPLPPYRLLIDLIFWGDRSELFPIFFISLATIVGLRFAFAIPLAVATMSREGHCPEPHLGDLEPAGLAHAVVRLVHSLERIIYFEHSVPSTLRQLRRHMMFVFVGGKV